MAGKNKEPKETYYEHRDDAEWLSIDICNEYRRRAERFGANNSGTKRELALELQRRCDIPEIQAINILNGFYARDYVAYYERMRNHALYKTENSVDLEYLEWLEEKETSKTDEFGFEERD